MPDGSADSQLTDCPSCGRPTRTVGGGVCAECWQPKVPGARGALREPQPRTEPLLGIGFDVFDLLPGWAWAMLATGVILSVVGVVVRAFTS